MSETVAGSSVPIQYMGFWDVLRIFIARYFGHTFLFSSPFSEALDDYPDSYKVYLLPDIQEHELPKDWTTLAAKATRFLCEVPVSRVQIDSTLRQTIDAAILDEIAPRRAAVG
jgi:hypothetical protein